MSDRSISFESYQYTLFNSKKLAILAVVYILVTLWPAVQKMFIDTEKTVPRYTNNYKPTKRSSPISKFQTDNKCSLMRLSEFIELPFKQYKQSIDDQEQDQNLSKFYNITLPVRSILQAPTSNNPKAYIWRLSLNVRNSYLHEKHKNNNVCYFLNLMNLVTLRSVDSLMTVLAGKVQSIFVVANAWDYTGNQLFIDKLGQYIKTKQELWFDSDYNFIKTAFSDHCNRVISGVGGFEHDESMIQQAVMQAVSLPRLSMAYTSACLLKGVKTNLTNLNTTDLQKVDVDSFYKYLYILDVQLLELVTPLNFAFYSRYTLEQIIIIPCLAVTQKSNRLRQISKILHKIYYLAKPMHQFNLTAPVRQPNSFCFISYPNYANIPNIENLTNYLSAVDNIKQFENSISLIVFLPYNFKSPSLFEAVETLIKWKQSHSPVRIRLRVRANKTVSSLSVYESAYTYCPSRSLMISSRHNIVKFDQNFLQILSSSLSEKYHYYYVPTVDEKKKITQFQKIPQFGPKLTFRKSSIFQEKLKNIQIFKSDFLKSDLFWMLKCQQLDFYDTQSSFVSHMMESIKLQFYNINSTIVEIISRNQSTVQLSQIQNVKQFTEIAPLSNNILVPYRYNCLENPAFRRFAPEKMESNIHQIWIGPPVIPSLRMKLHYTIKQKNLKFKLHLWTQANITKEIAPRTYNLVQRVLEFNKQSSISMYAMAADLLRYELLVQFGGLYVDFKFQGLKPLNNFLRYDVLFVDYDIDDIRFGSPRAVGNTIMGGKKNNYHLTYLLNQVVNQYNLPMGRQINIISGGFSVRKGFTDEELFTKVGAGYHLLIPLPHQRTANDCGGFDKKFEADQQVVQLTDIDTKKTLYFGIPCRAYPEAYLVTYNPLARTWVRQKSFVN